MNQTNAICSLFNPSNALASSVLSFLLPVLVLRKLVIVSLYVVISGGTYHIIRLCGRCTPKKTRF